MKLRVVPDGFPCTFAECPPGLFVMLHPTGEPMDSVGIKGKYGTTGGCFEAYNESGENYCGKGLVIPAHVEYEEDE